MATSGFLHFKVNSQGPRSEMCESEPFPSHFWLQALGIGEFKIREDDVSYYCQGAK